MTHHAVTADQIAEGLHYFGFKESERLIPLFLKSVDSKSISTEIVGACKAEYYCFVQAVVYTMALNSLNPGESLNIKIRDAYLALCRRIFSENTNSEDEIEFLCERNKLRIAYYQKAWNAHDPRSNKIDSESNLRRAFWGLIFKMVEENDPEIADQINCYYLTGKQPALQFDIPDIHASELMKILGADIAVYINSVAKMKMIVKD